MDNIVEIIVELENEKLKFESRGIEKNDEKSVILFIGSNYGRDIEEYESKNKNIPNIYFGEKLVKKCVKLPFENYYDEEGECLFPKAKYEFFF